MRIQFFKLGLSTRILKPAAQGMLQYSFRLVVTYYLDLFEKMYLLILGLSWFTGLSMCSTYFLGCSRKRKEHE